LAVDGGGALGHKGAQQRNNREDAMATEITHFIGGKHVKGTSGRFADAWQPMTGELISRVPLASAAEVRAAVENARAAQPAWAATNPQKRARVLMKFVDLINQNMDQLAGILASEHGKTIPDAKGDIQRGLEVAEFCIGIPHLLKGEYTDGAGPGIDIYSMRQPLGVVSGITPFNFPAMIPLWKLCPAIACGNAFILKPSERDPGVPLRLAELMIEAGLPAGILNVVNGDKEAVDAILDDPDIKAVGFVGSTPIAAYIYARGCANGKRVQAFGGAKNHMVVMPDADMDQAVDALIGAGYGSAGERCMAISVAVPVGQKTADELVRRLIPRVESLKVGPSTDVGADYGPLVTKTHLEKVKSYIDLGVEEGAKLLVDGRGFKLQGYENGFYLGGSLFDHVTPDMRIYKEEIFGPVLTVARQDTYEGALRIVNEHEFGNGVAIFTRDGDAARDFASRVNVGMVGINVPIPVPIAYYTFGGWKRSGFGDLNQHGPDAVRFYTKTKTVTSRWPSGVKDGASFVIPTMN
jgi:malonate-semialdehyde dehydrogenase (acetylating)/methylmalonate-semialdehyde dehydrogenase